MASRSNIALWLPKFNRGAIMSGINSFFYEFFENLRLYDETKKDASVECYNLDPETLQRFRNLELQGIRLGFRHNQFDYLRSIIEAIDERKIMLLQGPVGIGKSFGYLLPLVETYKRNVLKKIVISTASIELQNQLLGDIEKVCKILGIKKVDVCIAKGIGNYACLKEVYRSLDSRELSPDDKKSVRRILTQILEQSLSDRADFDNITKNAWEAVKLKSRGACSGCKYLNTCSYYQYASKLRGTPFIITNHGYLLSNLPEFEGSSAIVIDEAHRLEEVREDVLSLDYICGIIDYLIEELEIKYNADELKQSIKRVFLSVKDLAKEHFYETNRRLKRAKPFSIVDAERLSFEVDLKLKKRLSSAASLLSQFCNEVMLAETSYLSRTDFSNTSFSNKYTSYKADKISKKLEALRRMLFVLQDMQKVPQKDKDVNSKDDSFKYNDPPFNIYYVSFFKKGRIDIGYRPANTLEKFDQLFNAAETIVLTSATMGATMGGALDYVEDGVVLEDDYEPIMDSLHLGDIGRHADVERVPSVFPEYDYESQVLATIDTQISEPNYSDKYIAELAVKIDYAIRISEGKALILFTSKDVMNRVYEYISNNYRYPFKLLLQTDNNVQDVKREFSEDVNSCLFSTGFWEGIDVKGPALSNLIITHLPFDNIDAITEARISKYSNYDEAFQKDIFPRMRIKFVQGFGRLIRSTNDTGLFFCFDSRIRKYMKELMDDTLISLHLFMVNDYRKAIKFYQTMIKPRAENRSAEEIAARAEEWRCYNIMCDSLDEESRINGSPLFFNGADLAELVALEGQNRRDGSVHNR